MLRARIESPCPPVSSLPSSSHAEIKQKRTMPLLYYIPSSASMRDRNYGAMRTSLSSPVPFIAVITPYYSFICFSRASRHRRLDRRIDRRSYTVNSRARSRILVKMRGLQTIDKRADLIAPYTLTSIYYIKPRRSLCRTVSAPRTAKRVRRTDSGCAADSAATRPERNLHRSTIRSIPLSVA